MEERRGKVLEYLNHQDVSDEELKIEVFVLEHPGVSFSHGKYFVVYEPKSGLDHTVHELTHSLDWQQNFRAEFQAIDIFNPISPQRTTNRQTSITAFGERGADTCHCSPPLSNCYWMLVTVFSLSRETMP